MNVVELKRILCPVDFFPASDRAFAYAVEFAAKFEAQVRALHVIPRMVPTTSSEPVRTSPRTKEEEKQCKLELEKLKGKAETEIRIGDVDFQILDTIKDTKSDFLVMGTHGRRGLERWIVGSVVERMLKYTPVPLLIVGAGKGAAIKRILVTTDFSKGTKDAIDYALSIGEKFGAAVTILHIADNPSFKLTADIRGQLAKLVPRGAKDVTTRIETGNASSTILDVIKDLKPGLVVMNTHGQGMIDRLLIGSTAERVIRGAASSCPMLLIPPAQSRRKR